jgi:hypothetical protein
MSDWSFEEKVKYIDDKLSKYLESLGYQRNQRIVDHLIGTAYILRDMGALPYLVDAGLFHSVYGEASSRNSPPNSLIERYEVQEVVGKQAEEIVYQFCTISAPRTQNIIAMEDSQLRTDLIMLCKANDQEMGNPQ